MNIDFQKVNIEDVDKYIDSEKTEINNKLYSPVLDKTEAITEITNNETYFIKMKDEIVGMTEYKIINPDEAYLGGLTIYKKHRGKGLGRKAVEFRLNKIGKVKRIWLTTHPDNFKIINLYKSLGFNIESRKENCWGDGEPRIIMVLNN